MVKKPSTNKNKTKMVDITDPVAMNRTSELPSINEEIPAVQGITTVKKKRRNWKGENITTEQKQSEKTELRISEKRVLVTGLSRLFLKNEPMLTKMLRYFVNNNMLVDPAKQKLISNIEIESSDGKLGASVQFNLLPSSDKKLKHDSVNKELNNLDKDLEVSLLCDLDKDNFIHAVTIYTPTKPATKKALKQ